MIKSSEIKKGELLLDYEFPAYLYVTSVRPKEIDILVLQEGYPRLLFEKDVIMRDEFDKENTVNKVEQHGEIFEFIFKED